MCPYFDDHILNVVTEHLLLTYRTYFCILARLTDTCSISRIETLEKGRCEICSKLTIKTPERHQRHCSGVFIVNFEHISHLFLVLLLLT